jgi:hypothetical protein
VFENFRYKTAIITKEIIFETFIDNCFNYNDADCLYLKIGSKELSGKTFKDLSISQDLLTPELRQQFPFDVRSRGYLCRSIITCDIPMQIIDIESNSVQTALLSFYLYLGIPVRDATLSFVYTSFELQVNDKFYPVEAESFASALEFLEDDVGSIRFKSCFSCKYAFLHPDEERFFGYWQCLKIWKDDLYACKRDYQLKHLIRKRAMPVQEIWLCDEFELRKTNNFL